MPRNSNSFLRNHLRMLDSLGFIPRFWRDKAPLVVAQIPLRRNRGNLRDYLIRCMGDARVIRQPVLPRGRSQEEEASGMRCGLKLCQEPLQLASHPKKAACSAPTTGSVFAATASAQ